VNQIAFCNCVICSPRNPDNETRRWYEPSLRGSARPSATHLENTLAQNRSCRTTGVALIAVCVLATANTTTGAAAANEDAARCRAIERLPERVECFRSLKRTANPKMERGPSKHGPSNTIDEATNPRTDDPGRSPPSNDPASSGSIDHLTVAPGRPVCTDPDALAAMVLAGLLTSDPTKADTRGCQSIPDDARLEILERSPSIFPFMRIVRVKVTSPTQPDLTSGFTIEIGRQEATTPR
jgi:hypothetical protein